MRKKKKKNKTWLIQNEKKKKQEIEKRQDNLGKKENTREDEKKDMKEINLHDVLVSLEGKTRSSPERKIKDKIRLAIP